MSQVTDQIPKCMEYPNLYVNSIYNCSLLNYASINQSYMISIQHYIKKLKYINGKTNILKSAIHTNFYSNISVSQNVQDFTGGAKSFLSHCTTS